MEEIELIKDIIAAPNADTKYLQYKIEMLEKLHKNLQNNKYTKQDEATELTTVPKKKKPNTKKEVPYSIPYTSSDNVDMLI